MAVSKIKNELSFDYHLIGISTTLKEYKLCYHLNQLLNCDFRKLKDLEFLPGDRSRKIQFSVFRAGGEEDKNQFTVFSNKNMNEVLLPEIGNFDYVMQINGKFEPAELKILVDGVKKFPEIILVVEVPLSKIKSKERLIYTEEKHAQRLLQTKKLK